MRRLTATGVPARCYSMHFLCSPFMRAGCLLLLVFVSGLQSGWAQRGGPPPVDVLGVHNVGGRGCGACHPPHQNLAISGPGRLGLWEGNGGPSGNRPIVFGHDGRAVRVAPADLVTMDADAAGVLLCLTCHDGNVAPENMLANQSYEQKVGLAGASGMQRIQSFLDDADVQPGTAVDHPLGPSARIPLGNGLGFRNGAFVVIPGSAYAQFVANYGWPSLAPLARSNPYGIDAAGRPYLVCTTCHNQHAMNVYQSSTVSPIGGDRGGRSYTTFFFVNAPYNPNLRTSDRLSSSSNTQFCRQCHFSFANEANNVNNVRTLF